MQSSSPSSSSFVAVTYYSAQKRIQSGNVLVTFLNDGILHLQKWGTGVGERSTIGEKSDKNPLLFLAVVFSFLLEILLEFFGFPAQNSWEHRIELCTLWYKVYVDFFNEELNIWFLYLVWSNVIFFFFLSRDDF